MVWLALVGAWTFGTVLAREKTMDLQPDLRLRPLAAAADGIDRIRLAQSAAGLRLIVSATQDKPVVGARTTLSALSLTPNEGPLTTVATIDQLLPPPPAWDLALDAAGQRPAWVMERAMGGTYSVRLTGFDRREARVPDDPGLNSYGRPSFVDRHSDRALQAVVAIADDREAVLFERDADGRFQRRATLCSCIDATLLPFGQGFVLVSKRRVPGPVRGTAIAPGSLHLQALDARLAPVGNALEPVPGLVVYEFAADAQAGRLALLLTTGEGTRLLQSRAVDGPWLGMALDEDDQGTRLRSPTLALAADATAIALLDTTAGRRRILFGGTRRVPPP